MQVWKRRLAFVLAVGTGTLGLTLSTAGAQTPPDFPTFPTFPTFPDFPDFTIPPPPTMPPSTSPPSTSPPPTMPPPTFPPFPTLPTLPPPPTMPPTSSPPTSSPPPTMPPTSSPPTSVPSFEDRVNEAFDALIDNFEDLDANARELIEEIREAFFD
jgi:hypothetical protein